MPKIILHNEINAEDNAMLQALYSRSADSVEVHLEKLKKTGSGKFMEQYYLGYGHASIADCGFITLYIEGVSMLAAKAIQDNLLYNGQESSSRYIDWSTQPFYNPFGDSGNLLNKVAFAQEKAAEGVLQSMRNFYVTQKPIIVEHLKQQYPIKEGEKELTYEKAILAKSFDILRGFLPCGATTNLSWCTSLRKANEHLQYLSLHPLEEVRDLAHDIHAQLVVAYPNSIIKELYNYDHADPYLKRKDHYYTYGFEDFHMEIPIVVFHPNDSLIYLHTFNGLPDNSIGIKNRQRKFPLPKHRIGFKSRIISNIEIDFGSYRDLQRHRAGYCGVPVVTTYGGFHSWYFDQLPESSKKEALELFLRIDNLLGKDFHTLKAQYILPMGMIVAVDLDYDVHQALYVSELRSQQTVHATLRPVAQEIGKFLENELGIKTYCDLSEDVWNTRRGTQDIVPK